MNTLQMPPLVWGDLPVRVLMVFAVTATVGGCVGKLPFVGDPLEDVEKLSDVAVAEDAETVNLAASEAPGFFARLTGRVAAEATPDTEPTEAVEADEAPEDAEPSETTEQAEAAQTPPEAATETPAARRGLFGLFARRDPSPDPALPAPPAEDAAAAPDAETPVQTASAAPTRSGLLGLFAPRAETDTTAPDPDQVAPLTMQPFGVVGKTCGLATRDLGTKIASVSGFTVYDTFPNSTAPRPHYITGFRDRCARQFTAALVLTGDVGTHEVVRYQGSGRNLPYTETDSAYEQIKAQFCGVSQGQPCGRRLDALSRTTTFVTAYESFASSPVWADILLHNGTFVAVSVESR